MGNRLFVGGLPWAADERDLGEAFSAFGSVVDVKVIRDPETGKSRGFGFVAMSTPDECANAIRKMDGAMIGGRRVTVREAQDRAGGAGPPRPGNDRPDRPPRSGGPGPSYERREPGYDARPPRPPMDRGDRPPMDRGDRPPMDRGDRPSMDRGDRPPMDRGDRPSMDRGDRPPMDRGDRPPMDRPPRPEGGGFRGGGDRPPRPPGAGWSGGPRQGFPPAGFNTPDADGWSSDRGAQRKAPEPKKVGPDKKRGKRFDDWGGGMVDDKPRQRREKGRKNFDADWVEEDDDE